MTRRPDWRGRPADRKPIAVGFRFAGRAGRVAVLAAAAGLGAWLAVSSACRDPGPESQAGDAPLGRDGPVQAAEIRSWSAASLAAAPRRIVAEEPTWSMVPNSMDMFVADTVLRGQQVPSRGAFLQDGRIALVHSIGYPPDSLLLQFIDPESGDKTDVMAPRGDGGELLSWTSFSMATGEDGIVLLGNNWQVRDLRERGPRTSADVWYADWNGRFARPPALVLVDGGLLGRFRDGTLAMWSSANRAGTVTNVVSVRVKDAQSEPSDEFRPEVIFTRSVPGDPGREGRIGWARHTGVVTAVDGDTIWVLPTERPELVAVHRSGRVELMVEWDAGDRTVPPGASDFWAGTEEFPAGFRVLIGTDGLLYVRRTEVVDNQPIRSLEWLVFTRTGELVARMTMPPSWRWDRILAFGDGEVLALVRNDDGPSEVRIHAIERVEAGGG